MDHVRAYRPGNRALRLCAHLAGDFPVLLSDAGLSPEFRERDLEALLAAHAGEQKKAFPSGTWLSAAAAAVPLKFRHRFPVAGALYADDLHLLFS